jgi:hypothetical protein
MRQARRGQACGGAVLGLRPNIPAALGRGPEKAPKKIGKKNNPKFTP